MATVDGLQTTDTEEIVGEGIWGLDPPDAPPQPMTAAGVKQAKSAYHGQFFSQLLPVLHFRLFINPHLPERAFSFMRGDLSSVFGRMRVALPIQEPRSCRLHEHNC